MLVNANATGGAGSWLLHADGSTQEPGRTTELLVPLIDDGCQVAPAVLLAEVTIVTRTLVEFNARAIAHMCGVSSQAAVMISQWEYLVDEVTIAISDIWRACNRLGAEGGRRVALAKPSLSDASSRSRQSTRGVRLLDLPCKSIGFGTRLSFCTPRGDRTRTHQLLSRTRVLPDRGRPVSLPHPQRGRRLAAGRRHLRPLRRRSHPA